MVQNSHVDLQTNFLVKWNVKLHKANYVVYIKLCSLLKSVCVCVCSNVVVQELLQKYTLRKGGNTKVLTERE